MKISLNWLKDYITLSHKPAAIAKLLTMAGLEVDGVESAALRFEGVVVGRVMSTQKHPNADKLCVAMVSDGSNTYQVVCGASNCREGLKTAFAPIGAILKDEQGKPYKIQQAKLRGIESFGMLCSAVELGIGKNQEGIIEFAEHLKEGTDIAQLYADAVFEISLTPNLNHCSSLLGVARELAASTGEKVRLPEVVLAESPSIGIAEKVKVEIQDTQKCPRYACRLVQGVAVAPSPEWLQNRLQSCDIRPINNVVDITNYVLLEMGHPLHAFDFDKLEGGQLIIRTAANEERFVTLDGKERVLNDQDLIICDQTKGVAIAGVMGGANSEVSDTTRNVLIEAAYFQPSTIRKTSKKLGLQTDASKRFERGTDPNNVLAALDRAAAMIMQIAGGQISAGTIDIASQAFPPKEISCRFSRILALLGTSLSISEVETVFQRLGMPYHWDGKDVFRVTVPTFRVDISQEIDLIEEVARIYGYDNLQRSEAQYHDSPLQHSPFFVFEREIRERLIAEGLQEFLTCDLIGPTSLNIVQDKGELRGSMIQVLNPTSIEQSILRTSLLPGLLQVVKFNIDHQHHDISGFEIGRIHFKEGDVFKEQSVVGIILTGKHAPHDWQSADRDVDFYDLKGVIENLLAGLNIKDVSFRTNALDTFHSGRRASIFVGSLEVGSLGEIHPSIQRRLDVRQRIYFAECNLNDLLRVRKFDTKMHDIPLYPSSERDWTITVPEDLAFEDILQAVKATPSVLLEEVKLIAIYRSEKLGIGLKNVTLRFTYRDKQKTIEQEIVDAEHSRLTAAAQNIISQKNKQEPRGF